jgi:hypothetical protein
MLGLGRLESIRPGTRPGTRQQASEGALGNMLRDLRVMEAGTNPAVEANVPLGAILVALTAKYG